MKIKLDKFVIFDINRCSIVLVYNYSKIKGNRKGKPRVIGGRKTTNPELVEGKSGCRSTIKQFDFLFDVRNAVHKRFCNFLIGGERTTEKSEIINKENDKYIYILRGIYEKT